MKQHLHLLLLCSLLWLTNCQPTANPPLTPTPLQTTITPTTPPLPPPLILTPTPTPTPPPTPTITPTPTSTPTPTITPIPTSTPTPTPLPPCTQRLPQDNLFTLVTRTYGLSRDYTPTDLIPIADHFPVQITKGYPTQIRAIILPPLSQMITDMQAAGLQPFIISGFRSYYAQSIAYQKWLQKTPDTANLVSSPPGHSEHQLGTTIDFGSPELASIIGDPNMEFHTYFYKTSEGQWLIANAHRYGFTLSYPLDAYEITGFYYEPWHYRYIGIEMATLIHDLGISFTEYQLLNQPPPCIP